MQWDETLEQLDHTVTVPEAIARWGGDLSTIRCVSKGVNIVYRFETNGEGRYLRVTHDSLISESRVESALDYLRHLAQAGAQVCKPIASVTGKWIETWPEGDNQWLTSVTSEVPGDSIGLDHTDSVVYEAWGRSLGIMHRAAETYQPAPNCAFEEWSDLWKRVRQGINSQDILAQEEYKRLNVWYQALPEVGNHHPDYGLTHADYNPRNALWDGKQVTAIDFDEPSWGWYAADVARALMEFIARPREQRAQFREWFLRGYRSMRNFPEFWESNLNGFIQMRVLDSYALHTFATLDELEKNEFCRFSRRRFADLTLWD